MANKSRWIVTTFTVLLSILLAPHHAEAKFSKTLTAGQRHTVSSDRCRLKVTRATSTQVRVACPARARVITRRARVVLSHRDYGVIRANGCNLEVTARRPAYVRVRCRAAANIPTPTVTPTATPGGNISGTTGFVGGKCLVNGLDTGGVVNGTGFCSATGLTYIDGQIANSFLNGVLYQKGIKHSGVYQGGLYDQGLKISVNGALDKETFQQNGYVESDAGIRPEVSAVWPFDTTVRADGAIITMGLSFSEDTTEQPTVITRHLADGSPDPSFGKNGILTLPEEYSPISVSISGDKTNLVMWGKIIRLNNDGSVDTSFANGGILNTTVVGATYWITNRRAIQLPDGKLLVYAFSDYYPTTLGRFNSDGSIDSAFGNNGILTIERQLKHLSISAMTDGRLLLSFVDNPTTNYPYHAGLMRLHADGSIDTSFGSSGVKDIPFGYQKTAILSDGKVLGFQWNHQRIIRYLPDGSIDTTYGKDGIAQVPSQKPDPSKWGWQKSLENAFTVLSDGRAVVGGTVFSELATSKIRSLSLLVGFTKDGLLDTSFGVNGVQLFNFFEKNSGQVFALKTAPDGRIVGVGMSPTASIKVPLMVLFRVWY